MAKQVMSASQAKSTMEGAGAPPELMAAAEARGLDLNALWDAVQQIQAIIADTSKSAWQKAWACLQVVLTLIPTGSAQP